ncbi:helix-turn-helix transcriptional regulator [Vibrio europaeus]|uniref:AraC family transcriptional regulator n=1 Tax=Vibrio europaeus TaxID=300876 RepID=UPI00148C10B9|nr:helix-turn-helix transcriptional regulator [Vibrio europaeus]MDC5805797.1 helix-turn-helix transcriptional regulator [Vibrio europaeus]MDC5812094.1 helix-turn-helix transcriptional regulator [Vibrio europaeus]MDC5818593.1 helix-turn-helix transcriptional regulator [Vibrio europaeus]MDC5826130.1 helix-turn-helix transcriptional regulator [Vibrio europaeus]MDC5831494.1 helix-turn-helix transcriptional regulator [Vibrio europaeus]
MALINDKSVFDVDTLDNSVIGIAARIGKHDSGMHIHSKAQLLYAPEGCISIQLDDKKSVLPPTRAAWIPAGVRHCATMNNVVEYRSLYFEETIVASFNEVKIISVNSLLKALIERMSFWQWDKPKREMHATLQLFLEELQSASEYQLTLPFPNDPRLNHWLDSLQQPDSNVPNLNNLAKQIGASSKTISRIFSNQAGMPYQSWRQQWRLLKSIELLSQGKQVNDVAYQLDFSSDSAFITFFKQQTGTTPLQYMRTTT